MKRKFDATIVPQTLSLPSFDLSARPVHLPDRPSSRVSAEPAGPPGTWNVPSPDIAGTWLKPSRRVTPITGPGTRTEFVCFYFFLFFKIFYSHRSKDKMYAGRRGACFLRFRRENWVYLITEAYSSIYSFRFLDDTKISLKLLICTIFKIFTRERDRHKKPKKLEFTSLSYNSNQKNQYLLFSVEPNDTQR